MKFLQYFYGMSEESAVAEHLGWGSGTAVGSFTAPWMPRNSFHRARSTRFPRLSLIPSSLSAIYLRTVFVPFPKKQTQKRSRKPNEPKVLNQPAQSGKQNAREPATPKQSGDANDYKKPQCTQKCRPESELGKQNAEGEGARLLSN